MLEILKGGFFYSVVGIYFSHSGIGNRASHCPGFGAQALSGNRRIQFDTTSTTIKSSMQ